MSNRNMWKDMKRAVTDDVISIEQDLGGLNAQEYIRKRWA